MNLKKFSCILLDFDETLAYYKDNKKGLWEIFLRQNIQIENIKEIYEQTNKDAFSPKKFARKMKENFPKLNYRKTQDEIKNWAKNNLVLYNDAQGLIDKIKNSAVPFGIFTFGSPDFQNQKIQNLNLKPNFIIYSTIFPKIDSISLLLKNLKGPILFIDNSLKELEAARKTYDKEKLETIWVNKKNLPNTESTNHIEIKNLSEI